MDARCIVWHPRASTVPSELVSALDRRGLAWKAWDSDLLALAEFCRAREEGVSSAETRSILLLVDPPSLSGVVEVMGTIERYRPNAAVWVFDEKLPGRLVAMDADDIAARYSAKQAPIVEVLPRAAAPSLRLSGDSGRPPAAAPRQDSEPLDTNRGGRPGLLSDEELEMLLHIDDDPRPGPQGGGAGGVAGGAG